MREYWIRSKVVLLILLLAAGVGVLAQPGANPFELLPRLQAESISDSQEKDDSPGFLQEPTNPFEIIRQPQAFPSEPSATPELIPTKQVTPRQLQPERVQMPEIRQNSRFVFGLILAFLVLVSLVVTFLRPMIGKAYQAFFNDNLLSQLQRDRGPNIIWSYRLLYLVFLFSVSTFVYLAVRHWDRLPEGNQMPYFLLIFAVATGLFLFKHLLLRFMGWLFPIGKEMAIYDFTIVIFNVMIGLLLVPFNVLLAYGGPALSGTVFWLAIGLIGAVYLFRYLRGLFLAGRFLAFHKFHFLLYLCAIEIAPALVFIKLILLKTGA